MRWHVNKGLLRRLYYVLSTAVPVHKVKIHLQFLCVICLLFQSALESYDNWPALPANVSPNNFSYVPLQTPAVYHEKASCENLHVGANLAFCFCWIRAVDWWFLKSCFQWWSLKMSAGPWGLSLIRFSLSFTFYAVSLCKRLKREKLDSSIVLITNSASFTSESTLHWLRNRWTQRCNKIWPVHPDWAMLPVEELLH